MYKLQKVKRKINTKLLVGLFSSTFLLGVTFTSCSVEVKNTNTGSPKTSEPNKKSKTNLGKTSVVKKEEGLLHESIKKAMDGWVKNTEKTNVLLEEILRVLKEKGTSGIFKEKRPQVAKETKQKLWVVYY